VRLRMGLAASAVALLAFLVGGGCARGTSVSGGPSADESAPAVSESASVTPTATLPPSALAAPTVSATVPASPPSVEPSSGMPGEPSTYLATGSAGGSAPFGGLVEVSSTTGQVLRQLVPGAPGGGSGWPTLPADHSVIYVQEGAGTCGAVIQEISPTGSVIRSEVGAAVLPNPNDEQVDGLPTVSRDGRFLAFHRRICDIGGSPGLIVNELVILSTATGRDLGTLSGQNEPASPQAWSPDGRSLLTYDYEGPQGTGKLHILAVDTDGRITGDRALSPPGGCAFQRGALFDPATSRIDAVQTCGATSSIVVVDPATGATTGTTLTVAAQVIQLQAIDASGRYLIYGVPASGGMAWFVLSGGRSKPLPADPLVETPSAWLG